MEQLNSFLLHIFDKNIKINIYHLQNDIQLRNKILTRFQKKLFHFIILFLFILFHMIDNMTDYIARIFNTEVIKTTD